MFDAPTPTLVFDGFRLLGGSWARTPGRRLRGRGGRRSFPLTFPVARILVIDDDSDVREVIDEALDFAGV